MIAGEKNIGKRFVVAHQHIEARLHLLDVIGLEQQRLGLGRGRDEDHRGGQCDHPRDAVRMAGRAHIARDALAHAFRLADIENLAVGADHAIDAGTDRRMFPMGLDRGDAARERSGRAIHCFEAAGGDRGIDHIFGHIFGCRVATSLRRDAIFRIGIDWGTRLAHRARFRPLCPAAKVPMPISDANFPAESKKMDLIPSSLDLAADSV